MSRSYIGQSSVIEYIMSLALNILPEMEISTQKFLKNKLTSFVSGITPYEECARLFEDGIGTSSPVEMLRSVLECNVNKQERIIGDSSLPDDLTDDTYTCSGKKKRARPWTNQEDKRLLAGILHNGTENWTVVSDIVGPTRTRAQCSQRWLRGLDPRISKKRWTTEEDVKLLSCVDQYGDTAWAKIAASIGNRSDVQCRYHYQQIKKAARKQKKKALKPIKQVMPIREAHAIDAAHMIQATPVMQQSVPMCRLPSLTPAYGSKFSIPPIVQSFRIEGNESSMLSKLGSADFINTPVSNSAGSIDLFLQHFGF